MYFFSVSSSSLLSFNSEIRWENIMHLQESQHTFLNVLSPLRLLYSQENFTATNGWQNQLNYFKGRMYMKCEVLDLIILHPFQSKVICRAFSFKLISLAFSMKKFWFLSKFWGECRSIPGWWFRSSKCKEGWPYRLYFQCELMEYCIKAVPAHKIRWLLEKKDHNDVL